MALTIQQSSYLAGYFINTKVNDVNLRTSPDSSINTNKAANIPTAGVLIGTSTGRGAFDASNVLKWVEVQVTHPAAAGRKLWVYFDSIKKSTSAGTTGTTTTSTGSSTNANKTLLDNLVKSDVMLYQKMLINAQNILKLQKKGHDINPYLVTMGGILQQYNARQQRLRQEAKSFEAVKTVFSFAPTFTAGDPFQTSLRGLGIAPLIWVAIVVGSMVFGAGVLAWMQPAYDASKANLKVSDDLAKALESVDPKVRADILADLESQLDETYGQGKTDQWWTSNGWWVKTLIGIGIGAGVIIYGPGLIKKAKGKSKK